MRVVEIPMKRSNGKKMHIGLILVVWDERARAFKATITFDDVCCKYRDVVGLQLYASDPEMMEKMLLDIARIYPPKEPMRVLIPDIFASSETQSEKSI